MVIGAWVCHHDVDLGCILVQDWFHIHCKPRLVAEILPSLRTVLNWHCQCGDIRRRTSCCCWEYRKLYCYCEVISVISLRCTSLWISTVLDFAQCCFIIATLPSGIAKLRLFTRIDWWADGIHQRRVGCYLFYLQVIFYAFVWQAEFNFCPILHSSGQHVLYCVCLLFISSLQA